jgi:hypothetical protein
VTTSRGGRHTMSHIILRSFAFHVPSADCSTVRSVEKAAPTVAEDQTAGRDFIGRRARARQGRA